MKVVNLNLIFVRLFASLAAPQTNSHLAPCPNTWEPLIVAKFGFERIHLLMALPSVFFMSVDVTFLRDFKSEGSKFILNSYRRLSHLRRKKKKLIGTEKKIFAGSLPRFREREKKSPKFETGKLFESNRQSCLKVKPPKTNLCVRPADFKRTFWNSL